MSEVLNTSFLGDTLYKVQDQVDSKVMIDVDHVTMVFNIASEKLNSLKEYAIALPFIPLLNLTLATVTT